MIFLKNLICVSVQGENILKWFLLKLFNKTTLIKTTLLKMLTNGWRTVGQF